MIEELLSAVRRMLGASAGAAGRSGYPVAPAAGQQDNPLCGDNTWKNTMQLRGGLLTLSNVAGDKTCTFTMNTSTGNLTVAPSGGTLNVTGGAVFSSSIQSGGQITAGTASGGPFFQVIGSLITGRNVSDQPLVRMDPNGTPPFIGMSSGAILSWSSSAATTTGTDTSASRVSAGVVGFANSTGTAGTGALCAKATQASKTGAYTTLAGDANRTFDNFGTTARVDITLIAGAAAVVGTVHRFACMDSDGIRVLPNAADVIWTPAGATTAATGYIETATLRNVVELMYMGSNIWLQTGGSGSAWTVV